MKNVKSKIELLESMTKNEIISWLRGCSYVFMNDKTLTKSYVAWIKYKKESDKNMKINEALSKELSEINQTGWDIESDKLAKKFNETRDIKEKLLLAEKIQKLRKPFHDWIIKNKAQMEKEKKTKKLYRMYDKLSEEERGANK